MTINEDPKAVGVALSGGGSRATVFGLGALLALADSELNHSVTSISSVSGGSIANGVAMTTGDYAASSGAEFAARIKPAVLALANDGILLRLGNEKLFAKIVKIMTNSAKVTQGYVRMLFGSLGLALIGLIALIVAALARWQIVAIVALAVLVVFGILGARLWRQRSIKVQDAFNEKFFNDQKLKLSDFADRPVHHVICTTDLENGVTLYLSNRVAYGHKTGVSAGPPPLAVAAAVQASAAIPPLLAPRQFTRAELGIAGNDRVCVNDGGTYDNLADQWEYGYVGRQERLAAELARVQHQPAEVLIVVNASGGWNDRKPVGHGGLAQEFAGVKRSLDVQYDMSTAHRKRALYAMFREATASGKGLSGVFVQITDGPYRIIAMHESRDDALGARAREARAFLSNCGYSSDEWEQLVKRTRGIATTLAALGADDTAKLLEHGYVLTMVNAYVIQNVGGLIPVHSSKFEAICRA